MKRKNFVYTPFWVRVISILALFLTLSIALYVTYYYLGSGRETWILASLGVAQVTASGLVVVLLVFFSERDASVERLQVRTDFFLLRTLPRALVFIDFPLSTAKDWRKGKFSIRRMRRNRRNSPTRIDVIHSSGNCEAYYRIKALGEKITLRVQLNVSELTVSYYFPSKDSNDIGEIKNKMAWAISRYTDIGKYIASWYFSTEKFDGKTYISVHLAKEFSPDFLEKEAEKLKFSQDVTASTRSLIKHCKEVGVSLGCSLYDEAG